MSSKKRIPKGFGPSFRLQTYKKEHHGTLVFPQPVIFGFTPRPAESGWKWWVLNFVRAMVLLALGVVVWCLIDDILALLRN